MSQFMWNRVHRLKINVPEEAKKDLDRAFETETGKDCDEAAKTLSDSEFEKLIKNAIQRIRKKEPMIAYA